MGCGRSILKDRDMEHLLRKTTFSREQITAWHEIFMEECPNGKLSKQKFYGMYGASFPESEKGTKFYKHMFRAFDSDNSGSLEFCEFMMLVAVTEQGSLEEILNLLFRLYDVNGDRKIELPELSEIIRDLYIMKGRNPPSQDARFAALVKDVLHKLDDNGDGTVSRKEFISGCLRDPELYLLLTGDNFAQ